MNIFGMKIERVSKNAFLIEAAIDCDYFSRKDTHLTISNDGHENN